MTATDYAREIWDLLSDSCKEAVILAEQYDKGLIDYCLIRAKKDSIIKNDVPGLVTNVALDILDVNNPEWQTKLTKKSCQNLRKYHERN